MIEIKVIWATCLGLIGMTLGACGIAVGLITFHFSRTIALRHAAALDDHEARLRKLEGKGK